MTSRQKNQRANSLSSLESSLIDSGINKLAGVDEVGRGCLAGPVVAACVVLPDTGDQPVAAPWDQITDSKLLTPKRREELYDEICSGSLWSVAAIEPAEIDQINIHYASLKAMRQAVEQISPQPDYLLVDGRFPIEIDLPQRAVIKGDRECRVIGAASIIAKVWRDRLMVRFQADYPHFGFEQHKGYGTAQHRNELKRHGPTEIHRKSFKGVT